MKHSELTISALKDVELKLVYGDNKGDFSLLYNTYKPIIESMTRDFLKIDDIEDIVQEVFIKIFVDFNLFINQLPKRSLNSWIRIITRGHLVAYKNELDRNLIEVIPLYDKRTKDSSVNIVSVLIDKDLNDILEKICKKILNYREYKILTSYILGVSEKELAVEHNYCTESIRTILHKCRKKILVYSEKKFPNAFTLKKRFSWSTPTLWSDPRHGVIKLLD